MSTKDTLENLARNTWLAGLGSINSSKDALGKSIEDAQEKSNSLYNELLSRGEEIQSKINEKTDEIQSKIITRRKEFQTKGKNLLGISSEKTHDDKLAQLNTAVDQLTTVVVALIEKRNAAEVSTTKASPKVTKKPSPKAKAVAATKPVETQSKTVDAATKPSETQTKTVEAKTNSVDVVNSAVKAEAQETPVKAN